MRALPSKRKRARRGHHYYMALIALFALAFGAVLVSFSSQFEISPALIAQNPLHITAGEPFLPKPTVLYFTGDIMLSRHIGDIMVQKNDWRYPFLKIAHTLNKADLVMANLETPVSTGGTKVGSIYSFRSDPRVLAGLKYANISVVNLANNHIWDYGASATRDTFSNLTKAGIAYVGAGTDYTAAHRPYITRVKGAVIAILGYTNLINPAVTTLTSSPAVAFIDKSVLKDNIAAAKKQADLVIVNFHWGQEYKTTHNAFQERIGEAAIDDGASLVVGHHPHVPEELVQYHGGWIAYSLGNFVFDQNFSADTSHGLLLKVTLIGKTIASVESLEVKFTPDFQPYLE